LFFSIEYQNKNPITEVLNTKQNKNKKAGDFQYVEKYFD